MDKQIPPLQEHLQTIVDLLHKHRLVESLASNDRSPRKALIASLVHRQNLAELGLHLRRLHPADVAYILESLPEEERHLVWDQVWPTQGGAILPEVSDEVRVSLLDELSREQLLSLFDQIDPDDLSYVAEDIPEDLRPALMQTLEGEDRRWVQSYMDYPEDTVGYLMTHEMVVIRAERTLMEILAQLREQRQLPEQTDTLFVVDEGQHLQGTLTLEALLVNPPNTPVSALMQTDITHFHPDTEADDAARAFERYDLISAPVVDDHQRLVGRLTVDAVMDFLRDESDEDLLGQVGLSGEEDLFAPVWRAARGRWLWLGINLITAFLASRFIGLFEGTIERLVALATLMPIVASVGGNTGNQTVALMIRGLALDQIGRHNAWILLRKEVSVAALNGLLWGGIMGLFTFALYRDGALATVMAVAMLLNLAIGALVGVGVPLLLERLGRDPAQGASVLLTFTTDSMGFFIFLGLASLVLL